jgi:hypothetical protein
MKKQRQNILSHKEAKKKMSYSWYQEDVYAYTTEDGYYHLIQNGVDLLKDVNAVGSWWYEKDVIQYTTKDGYHHLIMNGVDVLKDVDAIDCWRSTRYIYYYTKKDGSIYVAAYVPAKGNTMSFKEEIILKRAKLTKQKKLSIFFKKLKNFFTASIVVVALINTNNAFAFANTLSKKRKLNVNFNFNSIYIKNEDGSSDYEGIDAMFKRVNINLSFRATDRLFLGFGTSEFTPWNETNIKTNNFSIGTPVNQRLLIYGVFSDTQYGQLSSNLIGFGFRVPFNKYLSGSCSYFIPTGSNDLKLDYAMQCGVSLSLGAFF